MNVFYVVHEYPAKTQTFVVNEFEAYFRINSAAEIYVLNLDKKAARAGDLKPLDLELAFVLKQFLKRPIRTVRVSLEHFKYVQNSRDWLSQCLSLIQGLSLAAQIMSKTTKNSQVHIHSHFFGRTLEVASVAKLAVRDRHVTNSVTGHAADVSNPANRLRTAELARSSTFIVAASRNVSLDTLTLCGRHADLIVHCGVKVPESVFPGQTERFEILSVGRLVEKKGFDVALKAASVLRRNGIAFRWTFIGDGPEAAKLKRLQEELELDDTAVNWLGALPNGEVMERMSRSQILVLPSKPASNGDVDGIPVVLIEAMARHCLTVSTNVGGIGELIQDKKTGFLVGTNDYIALSNVLMQLIRDWGNWEETLHAAWLEVKNNFNIEVEVTKLARAFESQSWGQR